MTQQHPITPPPELVEDWIEIAKPEPWKRPPDPNVLCKLAAQWGADQQLEACCEWLEEIGPSGVQLWGDDLRKDCRPKPPSSKEQALEALAHILNNSSTQLGADTIRRALEQLPDSIVVFPSQC